MKFRTYRLIVFKMKKTYFSHRSKKLIAQRTFDVFFKLYEILAQCGNYAICPILLPNIHSKVT